MKVGLLKLYLLLLIDITVCKPIANGSPLLQEAYIQFSQAVCDNDRVGYFCDDTPCYYDSDCFNSKCNMYARCEPRIKFDL